nr:hypothetical protein [Brucella anthropi]
MRSKRATNNRILGTVAAVSAAFCIYSFFPGYIYSDVFDQYQQAVNSTYSDWHPPIVAYLFRIQYLIIGNGNWFSAINFAVGALVLYYLVRPLPNYLALIAFLIIFFSPLFLGQLGVPAKDVILSVILLSVIALISINEDYTGRLPPKSSILVLILCAIAALTRANAPFIVAPIVIYIISGWKFSIRCVAMAAIATLAMIAVSGPINHKILRASESGPATSLQIFDIGGISHFSRHNYFPGDWTEKEGANIEDVCYTPISWDNYAWGDCAFVNGKTTKSELLDAWKDAIIDNPTAYIKHRITYFNEFLRFIGDFDAFRYVSWTEPGYQNEKFPGDYVIHKSYVELMGKYPRQPWHLPFVWLALAVGLLITSSPCKTATQKLINCLSFASSAYIGAYLVIGVASDFRYVLPASYLIIGCFLLWWRRREAIGTKATGVAGGIMCLSIIASGALL